ncbi:MAG: thioredoxin [Marinoscillum sp.]
MSNFHELINRNKPTLVDFYADWCEPCKMVPPILDEVKSSLGDQVNILKVNVDKNKKAAHKYGISSIPTLLIFKSGKIMWRKVGVVQAGEIQKAIKKIA